MNSKKLTSYCFAGILMLGSLLSCVKDNYEPVIGEIGETQKGEMVLFTVGNTNVETMTKAATYYMPDQYRFVCRMYYKTATGSDLFDVTGGSDITSWLKVDGPIGNALYWRGNYPYLDPANSSLFDTSGNDYDATCFYWQNRKEHAFLAWTDLNRATSITYSPIKGSESLKFNPYDVDYKKHTGQEKELWVESGYQVYGAPNDFASWADLKKYLESGSNYDVHIKNQIPEGIDPSDYNNAQYYYAYGWSCKFSYLNAKRTQIDDLHATYGWVQYNMYYDKLPYEGGLTGYDIMRDSKGVPVFLFDNMVKEYKAEIAIKYLKTDSKGEKLDPEQGFTPSSRSFVERTLLPPSPSTIQPGDKLVESDLICGVNLSSVPVSYYEINRDGTPVLKDGSQVEFKYTENASDRVVKVIVGGHSYYCIARSLICGYDNGTYFQINADGTPKVDEEGNVLAYAYEPNPFDVVVSMDVTPEGQNTVTYSYICPAKYVGVASFEYYKTDSYGNTLYDETNPRYTFYYKDLLNLKKQEVIMTLPANEFDLTRGTRTSITQQPDICQALTVQAPLGATQSSNRVNLYFKHQFSQVQVNVKASTDLSVSLAPENILKVELLGVSEKGYVFTELNEHGEVEPTTYEPVDVSQYTENQLKENQYGTSFDMFEMDPGDYATGYLKSFNALTFGQLQAIRVTWEEQETGVKHVATYRVPEDNLRNLKSANKYIWNIEVRRGTLAIIRTEIADWIVLDSGLEYNTDGTIIN